ncbi:uncharacterized protein LOC110881059 [Helianthus annuus]|uniref:uncharacterized protein LOC110881059 n=1 Tax=Helianthus annuus TaxID=4232 RepID=UPI000B900A0D|nr:uncharacterized protein LOC110881059 [Helianthus annuus]
MVVEVLDKTGGTMDERVWKDIAAAGKELEDMGVSVTNELIVEMGNRRTVKFWLDRWCGDRNLREMYPTIFKIATNKHAYVAENATVSQDETQWFIRCNRPPNMEEEWSQWSKLLQQIKDIQVKKDEDRWAWKSDSYGTFSVTTIRNHLNRIDANYDADEWKFWNRWAPPKVNYFIWRTVLEKISVKRELARRGIPLSSSLCSRCGLQEETVNHFICECTRSQRIWENIFIWLKIPTVHGSRSCKDVLEFGNNLKGSSEWKKIINVIFQATIWNIWKSRNDKEFEGYLRNDKEITEIIKEDSFIWLKTRSKMQNIVWERWVDFNIRDVVR